MFEPLSISAALCLGYTALAGYSRSTSAFSPEATEISKAAREVMQHRLGSESLYGAKLLAASKVAALQAVSEDADQAPVSRLALNNAEQLVFALPDDLPMPEASVDPDGAISLTWFKSRSRIFSASVGESARTAYAWLDGSDTGHAVVHIEPPILPDLFLVALRSIIIDDHIAIRVT